MHEVPHQNKYGLLWLSTSRSGQLLRLTQSRQSSTNYCGRVLHSSYPGVRGAPLTSQTCATDSPRFCGDITHTPDSTWMREDCSSHSSFPFVLTGHSMNHGLTDLSYETEQGRETNAFSSTLGHPWGVLPLTSLTQKPTQVPSRP